MKKLLIISLFLAVSAFSAAAQTGKRKTVRKTGHAKTKVVRPTDAQPNAPASGLGSGIGSGTGNGVGAGTGNGVGSGSGNGVGAGDGGVGNGYGTGVGNESAKPHVPGDRTNVPLRIIAKPYAEITETARQNMTSGTVTLRITFLADGQIGDVSVVSGLPDGLNENAVKAAKQIKFEPQRKNNKPVTVVKMVTYNFTIY